MMLGAAPGAQSAPPAFYGFKRPPNLPQSSPNLGGAATRRAGICDRRNGVRPSFCVATILRTECPLWVKSRHCGARLACPLSAKFRLKSRPSLRTPGAPKVLRCLCGGLERCVSILCAHSDSRFDVRQTTAAGGSQDRGSRRFLVREFTNRHPIMVAEGQVPPDEPTSNTLEEFSNRFLTIFWLCQHAFDSG